MKVFKFFSGNYHYAYSGETEEDAKAALFSDQGEEITIDKTEEIPESEWDNRTIDIWEDNNTRKKPFKVSIREIMIGTEPELLFTNDLDFL